MKHYTLKELQCKCGCNGLTGEKRANTEALVEQVLDPLRTSYGHPVYVNSGYRCPAKNKTIGGAANSQHTKGEAADITAGSPEENFKLASIIVKNGHWDQMILEDVGPDDLLPRWIHVSWKCGGVNRREVRKRVTGAGPHYPLLTDDELQSLKGGAS